MGNRKLGPLDCKTLGVDSLVVASWL